MYFLRETKHDLGAKHRLLGAAACVGGSLTVLATQSAAIASHVGTSQGGVLAAILCGEAALLAAVVVIARRNQRG